MLLKAPLQPGKNKFAISAVKGSAVAEKQLTAKQEFNGIRNRIINEWPEEKGSVRRVDNT